MSPDPNVGLWWLEGSMTRFERLEFKSVNIFREVVAEAEVPLMF